MEFEYAEYNFEEIVFEITDTDDYIDIVERSIRTVKETIRCLVQELPFKRLTKFITKRLTLVAIRNLNSFSAENSILKEYSLLSILTGAPPLDIRAYLIDFDACAEVFKDNRLQYNSNKSRSTPAIALGLPMYRKPGQIFMLLVTRKRLWRKKWKELLILS